MQDYMDFQLFCEFELENDLDVLDVNEECQFDANDFYSISSNNSNTSPHISTEEESIENAPVVKKRRIRNKLTLPRVVRRDIRRSYAEMFANVSNSSDINMCEQFFKSFSVNNLVFDQRALDKYNDVPQYFKIDGMAVFLQFWYNRMHMVPDGIVQIQSAKIITRSGVENSVVSCEFSFSGTRIYDVPFETLIPSEQQKERILSLNNCCHIDHDKNDSRKRKQISTGDIPKWKLHQQTEILLDELNDSMESTHIYDQDIHNTIANALLLPKPIHIRVKGTIVMQLNEHKAITHLNFEASHPNSEK